MDADDFRSIDSFLGKMAPRDLQELEIRMKQLVQSPAWGAMRAMLRAEREQNVRAMSLRVLEHADYAHRGGLVKGLVAAETVIAKVLKKAEIVREAGGFEAETGNEGTG
jgi:hypothetical protein